MEKLFEEKKEFVYYVQNRKLVMNITTYLDRFFSQLNKCTMLKEKYYSHPNRNKFVELF